MPLNQQKCTQVLLYAFVINNVEKLSACVIFRRRLDEIIGIFHRYIVYR